MIIDGRSVLNGAELKADVLVAGAGPAGITIASELATAGHHVVLVESGPLDPDRGSKGLADGEIGGQA